MIQVVSGFRRIGKTDCIHEIDPRVCKEVIGENVKRMRLNCDLSIDELAEYLGLSPGFLGSIERGQRGLTHYNLIKMSILMNKPTDAILGITKEPFKFEKPCAQEKVAVLANALTAHELDFVASTMRNISVLRQKIATGQGVWDDEESIAIAENADNDEFNPYDD